MNITIHLIQLKHTKKIKYSNRGLITHFPYLFYVNTRVVILFNFINISIRFFIIKIRHF